MNPETIEKIVTMIGSLGDGAKEGFMYYLIALSVPKILGIFCLFLVIVSACYLLNKLIHQSTELDEYKEAYKQICRTISFSERHYDSNLVIIEVARLKKLSDSIRHP